jgi:hypothetical protein
MVTSSRVVVPVPFQVIVPLVVSSMLMGNVPLTPVSARSLHFPIFPEVPVREPLNLRQRTGWMELEAADAVPVRAKLSPETGSASRTDAISNLRTGSPYLLLWLLWPQINAAVPVMTGT